MYIPEASRRSATATLGLEERRHILLSAQFSHIFYARMWQTVRSSCIPSDYLLVLMADEKTLLVVCTDRARSSNGVVYSKAFGLEIWQVDPTWKTNVLDRVVYFYMHDCCLLHAK
jgi:hypothetical protein